MKIILFLSSALRVPRLKRLTYFVIQRLNNESFEKVLFKSVYIVDWHCCKFAFLFHLRE